MCSKEYEHCGHCGGTPKLWKNIFCSENCRDIYNVLNKYDGKLITKEDGIEQLKAFNLSVVPKFNDRFRKLAEELTPKKEVSKKETPKKTSTPKMEVKKESSTGTSAPKKKTNTRTRTRKSENDLDI